MSKDYEYIIFPDGSMRRISSDELMHWKYIRKERSKSGEWIYHYPNGATSYADGSGATYEVYDRNTGKGKLYKQTKSTGDGYGEYTSGKDKVILNKSNKLFSSKSKVSYYLNGTPTGSVTTKNIGILERHIVSASNWIASLFSKKK